MVELGEIRALGDQPDGAAWPVAHRDPRRRIGAAIRVGSPNEALAVSGGYGTSFEPSGRWHHLFDPATGAQRRRLLDVAVVAPRATTADALSTAIFVAGEAPRAGPARRLSRAAGDRHPARRHAGRGRGLSGGWHAAALPRDRS